MPFGGMNSTAEISSFLCGFPFSSTETTTAREVSSRPFLGINSAGEITETTTEMRERH